MCHINLSVLVCSDQDGFPFSTRDCGWIVADCTAEGLKALLFVHDKCQFLDSQQQVAAERLYGAVDVVSQSISNWILTSCQLYRVTAGHCGCGWFMDVVGSLNHHLFEQPAACVGSQYGAAFLFFIFYFFSPSLSLVGNWTALPW